MSKMYISQCFSRMTTPGILSLQNPVSLLLRGGGTPHPRLAVQRPCFLLPGCLSLFLWNVRDRERRAVFSPARPAPASVASLSGGGERAAGCCFLVVSLAGSLQLEEAELSEQDVLFQRPPDAAGAWRGSGRHCHCR